MEEIEGEERSKKEKGGKGRGGEALIDGDSRSRWRRLSRRAQVAVATAEAFFFGMQKSERHGEWMEMEEKDTG